MAAEARPQPGWRWAPAWVLAFVVLWPAPAYAEAVLVLGALVALGLLLLQRFRGGMQLLSGPAWALTTVLFCAYWLSQAISAVDAVDQPRALREVLIDLRYLPFLWLAASAVAHPRGRRITFGGLAVIALVWSLDAVVEGVTDTSPLFSMLDAGKHAISGHGMCTAEEMALADRVGGVLGPCNLKLGVVLASLAPLALFEAARRWRVVGWLAAAAVVGLAVLMAGTRSAWLTFALALVWSGWRLLGWRRLALVFLGGTLALALGAKLHAPLAERLTRSAAALQANGEGLDHALSGRSQIWGAAWCMIKQHPVNGVGARGFREVFPACDPLQGARPAWGEGVALHAHQIVLEILSETGAIGLLLWLAAAALAWRAWRYALPAARDAARPALVALAISVFPLNTHLAAYSTFWGSVLLLLAALYAGSLLGRSGDPPGGPQS